ncbi:MAG: porin family protein [Bradyrhizobium sp.]|uniref:outer membrane protein n=1 Tax=Bradyrhizobium sp. TaxID=376 RepID=UPI0023891C85|nr:outer membrane beta-barrel protein [Bradyrhizobium sp.]MDE2330272.1 porin family protein [Bradyrhizobium sp.]MDE2602112.1 porin family protein [Bradyrhizobium sp.]
MKLVVAVLAGLFGTASALAADLPARVYTKAPVMVDPGYNWSGFYIGGNIGYSWGRSSDTSTFTNGAGTTLFTSTGSSDLDGVVGGGQIGYNWQIQNWVWGLEADIQGTDEHGNRDFTCPTGVCTASTLAPGFALAFLIPGSAIPVSMEQKIDWFGTVRGRVGALISPRVLLYATGGLAYGGVNTNETIATITGFSNTDVRVGYTVGAGIEGAIGGNWTAKLEYLYVDLGRTSGSFATTIPAFGPGGASGNLTSYYSSHISDNILRVGLNYRFNSGPVVARY